MTVLFTAIVVSAVMMAWRPRRSHAYAETHFRVAPGLSLLYRPEPEVYWDCPWRVTHGQPLPLALIVKDAHRFPLTITDIVVECECDGETVPLEAKMRAVPNIVLPAAVYSPYFFAVFELALPEDVVGDVRISPRLSADLSGSAKTFGVSGHPVLSDEPLRVHVGRDPLPWAEGWTYADTHTHSWHTSDQIEFGAPPEVIARMAEAIGIDWVFVTDHSFDLTMPPDRWFGLDPGGERWLRLAREIKESNSGPSGVTLIRGEEVSCGSKAERNFHLLAYDVPELFPGDGDGAKRWLWWRNQPDLALEEVVEAVHRHGGLAVASHPATRPSLMERLVLNRGNWSADDLSVGLDAWEIWNTDAVGSLKRARDAWKRRLLTGTRVPVVAGSDAHGDFNRMRAVKMPFFALHEDFEESFGRPRTLVRASEPTAEAVFAALRDGRCVMTNGPFAELRVSGDDGTYADMGETIAERSVTVHIDGRSTAEFGPLERIVLYVGRVGGAETPLVLAEHVGLERRLTHRLAVDGPCYVRVEAEAVCRGKTTYALTNPIWIHPPDARWPDLPA